MDGNWLAKQIKRLFNKQEELDLQALVVLNVLYVQKYMCVLSLKHFYLTV